LLAVAVGAGFRVALAMSSMGNLNGDEAVTGLMAERIWHGHGYVFFAGQSYLGALEQYVQAPFVHWLPGRSMALHLPSLLWSSLAIWLVFLVGGELLASQRRAAVATWLFATGSAFVAFDGIRAMGAYNAALVVGLAALWLSLRRGGPSGQQLFAFGVVAAAGLWLTLVSVYLLVPACILMGNRYRTERESSRRGPIRTAAAVLAGAVVGYSPALIWALAHGRLPFPRVETTTTPFDRLHGLVFGTLPEILGLKWVGGRPVAPRWLSIVVVAALAVAWLVVAIRQRVSIGRILTLRARGSDRSAVLHVAGVIAVACYVASPFTWFDREPRYLYVAAPLIVWALASVLPAQQLSPRWIALALLAVVGTTVVSTTTLVGAAERADSIRHQDFIAVAAWMQSRGVTAAYGDYRTAYPFTYATQSRVAVVPFGPEGCRFPFLNDRVDNAPSFAYVLSTANRQDELGQLAQHGVEVAAHYETPLLLVLIPRSPSRARPWQAGLMTSVDRCGAN
jgi:hypothetical protein